MTDAPEWIWASPDKQDGWRWPEASCLPNLDARAAIEVKYVRADALDALQAENARLREALGRIAEYLPMFDYVGVDDYGTPSHNRPGSPFDRGREQEANHLSGIARAALTAEQEQDG